MRDILGVPSQPKQEGEIMGQMDMVDRKISTIQDRANALEERIGRILSSSQVEVNSNKAPEAPIDIRSEIGQQLQTFNRGLQRILDTIDEIIDRVRL